MGTEPMNVVIKLIESTMAPGSILPDYWASQIMVPGRYNKRLSRRGETAKKIKTDF